MSLMQLGKGSKFIIFAALACTLLIGFHLSSLSPLAQYQKWRLPTTKPDLHDEKLEAVVPSQETPVITSVEPISEASSSTATQALHAPSSEATGTSAVPRCHGLPGADDVLVIMRTGATEIKDKLPAHLNTTFTCYPNYVIFSDYAETFLGYEVHDVLKDIPENIKQHDKDFAHYRHVQEVGRAGLDEAELSGEVSEDSGPTGKTENAGWALDKWKFLPMMEHTYAMYPAKKWYIFVEPDTFIVWSTLLQWIPNIDSTKAYYFGAEVMIGDDIFAHGGSAFLLSKPALEKGVEIYNSKSDEWHAFTADHWAGDGVLGKALKDAGVDLTWTSPMIQGGNPSVTIDFESFKGEDTLWCLPAISYHHLIPSEVKDMWYFEERYLQSVQNRSDKNDNAFVHWGKDMSTVLHHKDTFKSYVLPNLTSERTNWTNAADEKVPDTVGAKMEDCAGLCEMKGSCRQYALGPSGCLLGSQPRMGRYEEGVSSGWLAERVQSWIEDRDNCRGRDGWLVP